MRRIVLSMLSLLAVACSKDIDEVILEEVNEEVPVVETPQENPEETGKENPQENKTNVAPVFKQRSYAIDEHSPAGSLIGTLAATDADGDTLTYALESEIAIDIDEITGEIKVGAQLHLNHESTENLEFTVSAFDGKTISEMTFALEIQDIDETTLLTAEEDALIDHFQYLTLWKGPHVTQVKVNRRWNEPIQLYLDGSISVEFKASVEKVIGEYNELFSGGDFSISLTEDTEAANGHLFFGTKEEVEDVWPDMYGVIKDGNYSGYAMTPSQNAVMISTRIWISNPIESLFKHEIGHSLGLGHSNQCEDENSIMCSQIGADSDFSATEADIFRYLYHRDFPAGLSEPEIEKLLAELIVNAR